MEAGFKSWAPVATLPRELRVPLRRPAMRQTAGVMLELVDGARDEIVLATPFADDAAVGVLTESLLAARNRGVDVTVITSVGRGSHFGALNAREGKSGRGRLVVTEVTTEISLLGSHAKVLVVDRFRAYIGSANLTAAGLSRNIEIGVEVSGRQVEDLARLLVALEGMGIRVGSRRERPESA